MSNGYGGQQAHTSMVIPIVVMLASIVFILWIGYRQLAVWTIPYLWVWPNSALLFIQGYTQEAIALVSAPPTSWGDPRIAWVNGQTAWVFYVVAVAVFFYGWMTVKHMTADPFEIEDLVFVWYRRFPHVRYIFDISSFGWSWKKKKVLGIKVPLLSYSRRASLHTYKIPKLESWTTWVDRVGLDGAKKEFAEQIGVLRDDPNAPQSWMLQQLQKDCQARILKQIKTYTKGELSPEQIERSIEAWEICSIVHPHERTFTLGMLYAAVGVGVISSAVMLHYRLMGHGIIKNWRGRKLTKKDREDAKLAWAMIIGVGYDPNLDLSVPKDVAAIFAQFFYERAMMELEGEKDAWAKKEAREGNSDALVDFRYFRDEARQAARQPGFDTALAGLVQAMNERSGSVNERMFNFKAYALSVVKLRKEAEKVAAEGGMAPASLQTLIDSASSEDVVDVLNYGSEAATLEERARRRLIAEIKAAEQGAFDDDVRYLESLIAEARKHGISNKMRIPDRKAPLSQEIRHKLSSLYRKAFK